MNAGLSADITLRALQFADAEALYNLDYSFETDRIYTLGTHGDLLRPLGPVDPKQEEKQLCFAFELVETPVDPPLYKDYRQDGITIQTIRERIQKADGGYVALVNNEVAGCALLQYEEWRSLACLETFIVGRQFRRYDITALLLNCASDWARKQNCRGILREVQNINYPAIQFYLRNGFEIWSVSRHFYPPGPAECEAAIFLGKNLR